MYRRTHFCVCDGQQEEMHLKHVAFLLKKFPERVVTFNTVYGLPEKLKLWKELRARKYHSSKAILIPFPYGFLIVLYLIYTSFLSI